MQHVAHRHSDEIHQLNVEIERLKANALELSRAVTREQIRVAELCEALKDLVDECEEYARVNNLHNADGSPATTGAMRHARAALSTEGDGAEREG